MKLSRLFQALAIVGLALALSTSARAAEDKPAPAGGGTTAKVVELKPGDTTRL